jgi:hypothetical protein
MTNISRGLAQRRSDAGLEPLALLVDQRDQGDRRLADPGGEQREIVERRLGVGVQDPVRPKRREPRFLVVAHDRPRMDSGRRYSKSTPSVWYTLGQGGS